MEQLSNMPLWAQILSMGSFMFASGVLMTRLPLAPAIILSFFYLYGVFTKAPSLPAFILQQPWKWTFVHAGIIGLILVLGTALAISLILSNDKDGVGTGDVGRVWVSCYWRYIWITGINNTYPSFY